MLPAEAMTEQVIGLAREAHRNTGPGLLEAVYEQCLRVYEQCLRVYEQCLRVELRRAGVVLERTPDLMDGLRRYVV